MPPNICHRGPWSFLPPPSSGQRNNRWVACRGPPTTPHSISRLPRKRRTRCRHCLSHQIRCAVDLARVLDFPVQYRLVLHDGDTTVTLAFKLLVGNSLLQFFETEHGAQCG